MRGIAVAVVGVVALVAAGAADAQIVWIGAGYGSSWEYQPETDPDRTWLRGEQDAATLFVGVPIEDTAVVRLAATDIPFNAPFGGEGWPGHFRAYTLGVDYFFPGVFGRAVFSAGAGQYRFEAQAASPPSELESAEFGWYAGLGEWFQLSRRSAITVELTMHRPDGFANPVLVSAVVGAAITF